MKQFAMLCIAVLASIPCHANWPNFRGPNNDGIVPAEIGSGLPVDISSENVKWETPIHDLGWSTPVIWGDQIWLTSATEGGHKMYVFCVDANSGKILLDKQLFDIAEPRPLGNRVNTYASPSCAIEEGRVYVHFGSYGTACIDTKTFKTLWTRDDLPCDHFRGPASSPVIYNDLLILTMDGADTQYQAALHKSDGTDAWKTDRDANYLDLDENGQPQADGDFRKAFGTPIIINHNGQDQMVISASYGAFGYDPATGKEIWRLDHDAYSPSSMALFDGDLMYICAGRRRQYMLGVKPGGAGEISKTHVAWEAKKAIPCMPSPSIIDGLIYMVNNGGVASCIEAKTGADVWRERVKGQFYASPVYADGRLYFFSDTGDITALQPGREFKILAESQLGDGFMASPAVSDNAFFLRSKSKLYRVEK